MEPTPITTTQMFPVQRDAKDANLRKVAVELETVFLAEMLKSTGLGRSPDSMNGGVGEDQFSSFLVQAQAEKISQNGGIGLAETLFHALKETHNDR